jgi:hypothetical protein
MLWRYAYDADLIPNPPKPRLIATLAVEQKPPKALTFEDVCRIVNVCRRMTGETCGMSSADFWTSLVLVAYWTGCRIGALLKTPSANYGNCRIEVGSQKTKKTQCYRLPVSACSAIDKTRPCERKQLWPWDKHRTGIFPPFRSIMESAGLTPPKSGHHLFHAVRRTNISYCAAVDPALAQRQANHSDYATTKRYYVDEAIANERQAADVLPDPLRPNVPPQRPAFAYRIVG